MEEEPGGLWPNAGGDERRWADEPGTRKDWSGARWLEVVVVELFLCSEGEADGNVAETVLAAGAPSPFGDEGVGSSLTWVVRQPSSATPFCTVAKYPSSRAPSLPRASAPSSWLRVDSELEIRAVSVECMGDLAGPPTGPPFGSEEAWLETEVPLVKTRSGE